MFFGNLGSIYFQVFSAAPGDDAAEDSGEAADGGDEGDEGNEGDGGDGGDGGE